MKDIVLILVMAAIFAFGFFAVNRLGRFMDHVYESTEECQEDDEDDL